MNSKRLIAGIIDFVIVSAVQAVLTGLFLIKPIIDNTLIVSDSGLNIMLRQLAITYCSLAFLIVRDIIGKKSVGKIIMKLKIIDKNDGEEASFLKRLLRNLTWLLGPIDIIVFLITKERLGDKIMGTNVVEK